MSRWVLYIFKQRSELLKHFEENFGAIAIAGERADSFDIDVGSQRVFVAEVARQMQAAPAVTHKLAGACYIKCVLSYH